MSVIGRDKEETVTHSKALTIEGVMMREEKDRKKCKFQRINNINLISTILINPT